MSTSISIRIYIEGSCGILWEFKLKENNVFAKIPLGAIIWDSGKKKRSDAKFVVFNSDKQNIRQNIE